MNKEESHHNHHGGFNSFLLGVIVGAAIVFLFATKKGKKILKLISEEGLDNLSKYVDQGLQETEEEFVEEVDDKKVPEEPIIGANGELKQDVISQAPQRRRFFKRKKS